MSIRGALDRWRNPNDYRPEFLKHCVLRPRKGDCPACGAPDDRWCESGCCLIDPMDYR